MSVVVITGIGKGIGKALAEKFIAEGFQVIGTYLHSVPSLRSDRLIVLPLDITDSGSVDTCTKEIAKHNNPVDILINNAGVLLDEDEKTVIPEKLQGTLAVNVVGTSRFTEKIIPLMSKDGHIVNASSTAGSIAMAGSQESHFPGHYPCYRISKAALNMYTATLALRLAEEGITVSAVHPGWVQTDMGGAEADITPTEAAEGIFATAIARPKTGGFWFKNERLPW